VDKFCDGIEKLGVNANGAIWELNDQFGSYGSQPEDFFWFSWFLMMLTISFGRNHMVKSAK